MGLHRNLCVAHRVYFAGAGWVSCPRVDRAALGMGAVLAGPAIVEQLDSTTVVWPGQRATVDRHGNLIVRLSAVRRPAATRGVRRGRR